MTLYILTRHSKPPDWVLALLANLSCLPILRAFILPPPSLYLSSSISNRGKGSQPRNSGTRRPAPMDRYFFSIGETRRILESGGWRVEREREGGEAGSISVNSSLNCHRLSIPYRGRFSFLASVAKCLDTRFEIEACFLFFFFDRGWKMVEPEFFEKSRNFLILLPRFFFGRRRFEKSF